MTEDTIVTINREHKDRLFNFIFGTEANRKWTLQLYNAVNGSDYEDETQIAFNTLQNYLYVSMKNDTSFVIAGSMNLYEHQSTYNPNMPLRMLRYLSSLYSKYVADNSLDIFGETIIQLPVPKLVVFYNGDREVDDETTLRLSDSFLPEQKGRSDIEVKVRMLNINSGHNDKIFQVCKPLSEYSWLIDRIKKTKNLEGIENAVTKAIDQMPNDFEIKRFLTSFKQEVIDMMLAEEQEINALELIAKANEKKR